MRVARCRSRLPRAQRRRLARRAARGRAATRRRATTSAHWRRTHRARRHRDWASHSAAVPTKLKARWTFRLQLRAAQRAVPPAAPELCEFCRAAETFSRERKRRESERAAGSPLTLRHRVRVWLGHRVLGQAASVPHLARASALQRLCSPELRERGSCSKVYSQRLTSPGAQ